MAYTDRSLTVLPVTLEETLILREPVPSTEVAHARELEELQQFIDETSKFTPEFLRMKKKMLDDLKLPPGPCYITSHLYDKRGQLVHVVGKGEFSGLDDEGKPMLLYDKHGLPKNADGSVVTFNCNVTDVAVRIFTIAEIRELQKKREEEELPSYLPRKPKLVKRKEAKKRKNPPPRKIMDDFDEMVAKETERLRKINERL